MRHLISGEDCAMAGEATVAIAAPAADTFKNSRRFIKAISLLGRIPHPAQSGRDNSPTPKALLARSLTWKFKLGIRDKGMTALSKRKSNIGGRNRDSGRGDDDL